MLEINQTIWLKRDGTEPLTPHKIINIKDNFAELENAPYSINILNNNIYLEGNKFKEVKFYLTPRHYNEEMRKSQQWEYLKYYINTFKRPSHLSEEDLKQITNLITGIL